MKHLLILEQFLLEKRVDFLKDDFLNNSVYNEDVFNQLVELDPSDKKIYLKWILDNFKKDKINQEDFRKVTLFLKNFDKYKNKLRNKDINQYKLQPNKSFEKQNAIINFYDEVEAEIEKSGYDKEGKFEGAEVIKDFGNNVLLVKPNSLEYTKKMSIDGGWCIKDDVEKFCNINWGFFIIDNNKPVFALEYEQSTASIKDVQGRFNSVWDPKYNKPVMYCLSNLPTIKNINSYNQTLNKVMIKDLKFTENFLKLNNLNLDRQFYINLLNKGISHEIFPNNIIDSLELPVHLKYKFKIDVSNEEINKMSIAEKVVFDMLNDEDKKKAIDYIVEVGEIFLSERYIERELTEEEKTTIENDLLFQALVAKHLPLEDNRQIQKLFGTSLDATSEFSEYYFNSLRDELHIYCSEETFYEDLVGVGEHDSIFLKYDSFRYASEIFTIENDEIRYQINDDHFKLINQIRALYGQEAVSREDSVDLISDFEDKFSHYSPLTDFKSKLELEIENVAEQKLEKIKEKIYFEFVRDREPYFIADFTSIIEYIKDNNVSFSSLGEMLESTPFDVTQDYTNITDEEFNTFELLQNIDGDSMSLFMTELNDGLEDKLDDILLDVEDEDFGEIRKASIKLKEELLELRIIKSDEDFLLPITHRINKGEYNIQFKIKSINDDGTVKIVRKVSKPEDPTYETKKEEGNIEIENIRNYFEVQLFENKRHIKTFRNFKNM